MIKEKSKILQCLEDGEGGWNLPNIVWWLDLDLPYKD